MMWRVLEECWSLPDADAEAQARLLDRQLGALIPFIPAYVTTNTLAALWMVSAFWSVIPHVPTLIWGGFFVLIHIGWLAASITLKRPHNRVPGYLYTRSDLWICAFWWFGETAIIGVGIMLCTPFISNETHRLLLVSFVPGLISAGAMASMMVPLLSGIWLGVSVPSVCIAALKLQPLDQVTTRSLLIVYAIALCFASLAISKMFVGRFKAETIADRERRSAQLLAIDLKRQKEIAEEANRAKSNFLAAASHDLRQPVHALGLFVGALQHTAMPPESARLVEQINASTNAMEKLFTALLDISRLDAGIVIVERRPFEIGRILERVCRDYESEAASKGIRLTYVHCRAAVDCDPALVERIARNLVSNAVRYTDAGKILVGCRRKGAHIVLQVWDTGRGIPVELQALVFQEYFQAGNPERDREKGLGLGLAIVRRLVDLLDCKLVLRSKPGKGSCFEVSIDRAESAVSELEPIGHTLIDTVSTGFIVVIDDEKGIRDGTSILLTRWGYEVLKAGSVNEAIDLLAGYAKRPDLVISDLRLRDGESGIDAVEQIRAEYNRAIPALLITGDTSPSRLAEAQASGLLLLHKPVSNGRLRAAITQLFLARQDAKAEGVLNSPHPV